MIINKNISISGAVDENSRPNHNGKRGIDNLLARLQKVKQTGSNRWIACCPSHQDNSPSMAICDDNGKILLKCFAGCSTFEIVSAVGMDMFDLFPEKTSSNSRPVKNPFPATDVLRCIQNDALTIAVIASDLAKGEQLTEERKKLLMKIAGRIGSAYE